MHKRSRETFTQYLNDIRLEQASMKLRLGDLSIGEIAASVGIQDQNYFARLFHKKYHMTPAQWKANSEETMAEQIISVERMRLSDARTIEHLTC
ncbi:MAG: helix-turn-helix transcriptional regulator [Parasporobacterium sp.]|nr:helix-turn-helix transcriptional regulator [Parasporobacterium sp.]